jgi:hypothetical protein
MPTLRGLAVVCLVGYARLTIADVDANNTSGHIMGLNMLSYKLVSFCWYMGFRCNLPVKSLLLYDSEIERRCSWSV